MAGGLRGNLLDVVLDGLEARLGEHPVGLVVGEVEECGSAFDAGESDLRRPPAGG